MNTFKFIKLVYDRKEPIKGQQFKDVKQLMELKDINLKHYNVGLVAGANNLLIFDIEYLSEFSRIS